MSTYTRQIMARLGSSKTWLAGTLGVAVIDIDGTTRLARTTSGISEQGTTGTYYKSVTWDTAWGDCRAVWDDSAGSPTFQVVGEEQQRSSSSGGGSSTVSIEMQEVQIG